MDEEEDGDGEEGEVRREGFNVVDRPGQMLCIVYPLPKILAC